MTGRSRKGSAATPHREYIVNGTDTLESAMAVIVANHFRCVIVLGAEDKVIGTLSDGDVRRAMLQHRLLSTPVHQVMNPNFVSLSPADRDEAGRIMEEQGFTMIPIMLEDATLVDVVVRR